MQLNPNEIERVKYALNLQWPVEIEWVALDPDTRGRHTTDGTNHTIQLNTNPRVCWCGHCKPRSTNFTLLHELWHAHQAEILGVEKGAQTYNLYDSLYGYEDNPMENEANEFAEFMQKYVQLIDGDPTIEGVTPT